MANCQLHLPIVQYLGYAVGGTRNRAAGEAVKWMVTAHLKQLISTSRTNNNTHTDEHKDNLRLLSYTHTRL